MQKCSVVWFFITYQSDGETFLGQPRLRREDQVKSDVEEVGFVAIIASFWSIDRERWQEIYHLKVRMLWVR